MADEHVEDVENVGSAEALAKQLREIADGVENGDITMLFCPYHVDKEDQLCVAYCGESVESMLNMTRMAIKLFAEAERAEADETKH